MQKIPQKQGAQRLQVPGKSSLTRESMEGNRGRKNNNYVVSSPRPKPRPVCTCSNHPGSVRCIRHGYVVPGETLRKNNARKVVLRRALTPPPRRSSFRWFNFRPTPSRLSSMSVAN
uniref:Uncharacterized protein n=1 Tax=Fagus sylvatica TaxID=28930 RepID=A0A2N9G9C0_FAGSY